jgi:radical SAM superfamily enzyme YgiQ (UPF0313 family)
MSPKHSITWNEMERAKGRLAGETGSIIKDWGGKLPFALVYPNSYFIGMSNLGLQAIYGFLNNRSDAVCERAFWDKENRDNNVLPVSVESQRPLNDFAVLAFSLNYEIDYFNIVPILKASGFPIYSSERDESQPLLIAGGPCVTANPMPVAPFFDCLCIGEAEALLPAMLPILEEGISGNRNDLLKALSKVPGVYVPRFNSSSPVARQWTKNLDDDPVHSVVLTQDTELSDLYLIEVERGCAHGCRFCLVHGAFSPMRFHSVKRLLEQAQEGLKYRRRVGLVGPAITDHPGIEEIFEGLLSMGAQFSVSSVRMTSLTPHVMELLVQGGLRSIALAPEAGSQRLRQVIKKGIHEGDVLQAIELAAQKGMQQLKLYFMIGLPSETDEDLRAIVDITLAGKQIIEKGRSKTRLTLNISPFIPKAGTPFQWLPMAPIEVLQQRISFLKNQLAHKGVEVKNESPQWSQVQAVLSRGDASLAKALEEIDRESLPAWRRAVENQSVDLDFFAHQKWDVKKALPWGIIESVTASQSLEKELAQSEVQTFMP